MTRRIALVAAVAAIGLCASQASAKPIPAGGLTAKQMAGWLQDAGYKAEIKTDDKGNQRIATAADGTNFTVYAENCQDGRCATLNFSVGFSTNGSHTASEMNKFNSENRFTRAYVDDVNDPYLEMDVDLSPGGTYESLDDQFEVYKSALTKFKKFINF